MGGLWKQKVPYLWRRAQTQIALPNYLRTLCTRFTRNATRFGTTHPTLKAFGNSSAEHSEKRKPFCGAFYSRYESNLSNSSADTVFFTCRPFRQKRHKVRNSKRICKLNAHTESSVLGKKHTCTILLENHQCPITPKQTNLSKQTPKTQPQNQCLTINRGQRQDPTQCWQFKAHQCTGTAQ